jgi:hypothetical protein
MLIALASASGAPGVTTTALALALHWPRPVVLVEADASGGSGLLAGYFRAQLDQPGLVDLVLAQRADLLREAVPRLLFPLEGTQASVLFGLRSHEQAAGASVLWPPLLEVLRDLDPAGTDVIVDAGRLGMPGWPRPLVSDADGVLLVTRGDLPGLAGARSWASALAADDEPGHVVRVLLIGEHRPYGAREVARTLGLSVLGSIEWAPELATIYSHGRPVPAAAWWRRIGRGPDAAQEAFEASGYVRSVRAAAGAVDQLGEGPGLAPLRGVLARAGASTRERSLG